jgi:hypothetical protein
MIVRGHPIRSHWLLIAAAAAATVVILVVTSGGLWFYYDEWEVIRNRGLDVGSLLRPHNEHFSAVLIAIHRGLIEVVGTSSYAPFLVSLWLTHLFASATVYVLLSEDGTPWQATAGALLFLMPGWGAHNLVTAFQIGFVLATGLGCLALAICIRRPGLAAGLLTAAVATQGVGLFFLAATGVRLLGRRSVLWLTIPAVVYGAWFLLYGNDAMDQHGPGEPASIPAFVVYGITGAFGQGSPVLGAVVIAAVCLVIRRRAFDRLVLASVAGLLSMFIATGIVRAQFGPEQALVSRYFTVALPFALVIVLAAWRTACDRYPIRGFGPVLVAVAIVFGLAAFATFRAAWPDLLAGDPAL